MVKRNKYKLQSLREMIAWRDNVNTKQLDQRWKTAVVPKAHELEGWYKVEILSGFGLFAGFFVRRWLKKFGKIQGNNCVDGKKEGYFLLSQHPNYIILDYDLNINNTSWRRVLDYIRQIDDKTLIGKLHVRFWDGYGPIKWFAGHRFQGFFTLTKIDEEIKHV